MGQAAKENLSVQTCAENLATFAVDRTDLKEILNALPHDKGVDLSRMAYELQILKIISVGWAISLYIPSTVNEKERLSSMFWRCIREISQNVSTLAGAAAKEEIDYFQILKDRLDTYVAAMKENPDRERHAASIMGNTLAQACMRENNPIFILAGEKMFILTIGAVKAYLESVVISDTSKEV